MKLPDGYRDSSSEFYIPEDLIEHYEKIPETPRKEHSRFLSRYARAKAHELVPTGESHEHYWAKVEQLENEADLQAALHFHYLQEAARRFHLFTKRTQQHAIRKRGSICPICEEVTIETPENPLDTRSLLFTSVGLAVSPHTLRSCLKCYLTAVQIKTEQAQAEKLGRKSRREIVEKALS